MLMIYYIILTDFQMSLCQTSLHNNNNDITKNNNISGNYSNSSNNYIKIIML